MLAHLFLGLPCAAARPWARMMTWSAMRRSPLESCDKNAGQPMLCRSSWRINCAAVPTENRSSPVKGSSYITSSGSWCNRQGHAACHAAGNLAGQGRGAPRRPTGVEFHQHNVAYQRRSGQCVLTRGKARCHTLKSVNSAPN